LREAIVLLRSPDRHHKEEKERKKTGEKCHARAYWASSRHTATKSMVRKCQLWRTLGSISCCAQTIRLQRAQPTDAAEQNVSGYILHLSEHVYRGDVCGPATMDP